MRLLYIASGIPSLADLDPNLINGFQMLTKQRPDFQATVFQPKKQPIQRLFHLVRKFRPDSLFSLRGQLPTAAVWRLRNMGYPIALYIVDDPYSYTNHLKMAKPYSCIITQDAGAVPYYQRRGIPSLHLPLAVNPSKYRPQLINDRYRSDICFVGSATDARVAMIDRMAGLLEQHRFRLIGRWWDRLRHYKDWKDRIINHPLPADEVARYYSGAKIVWNFHRASDDVNRNPQKIPACTPNNKTFEIAACGAFQLISHRRDLGKYYRINQEIVSFRGLAELERKTRYYLQHDAIREGMARKARMRTMKDHTYRVRLTEFLRDWKAIQPRLRRRAAR
ncbi:CgeB family protein [Marininema halotolerans]|uniref:Spore maturation protein CgeB n=1 Tax=Marininema halotolerans TaxID=1155944 RepID=A0A1I6RP58_9BACL|nr:glycosyltransferase [Marininema halotolerans]SFS66400.1 spore maturation protein CgeB [Marininema halotolerans]